jgi:hypothetical protein
MSSKQSRYVAIVRESDDIKSTFVFDGNVSLQDVFEKINTHGGSGFLSKWKTVTSIAVHRDESLELTPDEGLAQQLESIGPAYERTAAPAG